MIDAQHAKLKPQSHIGRPVKFKRKGGGGYRTIGIVEDEVDVITSDYKHAIQKIRFADPVAWGGSIHGYRTGNWTNEANKKRIVWGQYTQFLTDKQYKTLLGKARAKSWELF